MTAAESVESEADVTGADLCAKAGLNPWGLVWLLENYQKSKMAGRMEMLSDAPGDRIRILKAYFASAPERFAKFDRDRAHGTPMQ
jgi:predicted Zn-dependent protease